MSNDDNRGPRIWTPDYFIDQVDGGRIVVPHEVLPTSIVSPLLAQPSGTYGTNWAETSFELANPTNSDSAVGIVVDFERGQTARRLLATRPSESIVDLYGIPSFGEGVIRATQAVVAANLDVLVVPLRGGARPAFHLTVMDMRRTPIRYLEFTQGASGVHNKKAKDLFEELLDAQRASHVGIIDWAVGGQSSQRLCSLFFEIADKVKPLARLSVFLLHTSNRKPSLGPLFRNPRCSVHNFRVLRPMGEDWEPNLPNPEKSSPGELVIKSHDSVVVLDGIPPARFIDALITSYIDGAIRSRDDFKGDAWDHPSRLLGGSSSGTNHGGQGK